MQPGSAHDRPVVFACAGCSSAGRLAYDLALELDRRGVAEMSCLAGLACEKKPFLKKVAGREVWMIDGCPIECALGVMERIARRADVHIRLHDFGVRKQGASVSLALDELVERTTREADEQRAAAKRSCLSADLVKAAAAG